MQDSPGPSALGAIDPTILPGKGAGESAALRRSVPAVVDPLSIVAGSPVSPLKDGGDEGDPTATLNVVPVDKNSPVPAYAQIEQDLRRLIREGIPQKMPIEIELGRMYGVNRATVRQALERLANSGLIRRIQGWGTSVVSTPGPSLNLSLFRSVTEQLREAGYSPRVDILSQGHLPLPQAVAEAMTLPVGTPALRLVRVTSAGDTPISLNTSWFPKALIPRMVSAKLRNQSIWKYLRDKHGIVIAATTNEVEVTGLTSHDAELLKLSAGISVAKLISISKNADGIAVEHSTSLWAPDHVRFRFSLRV